MKTIQVLLPDNLHEQLQQKALEAGFDLSAYILALLAEGTPMRKHFPQVTAPIYQSPSRPSLPPSSQPVPPITAQLPRQPLTQQFGGTKGPQSNMLVVIKWDIIGKGNRESIRSTTAAATLVHIVSRFHKVLGADTLAKLADFRVSRGPLISRNPDQDFVNGSTQEIYANHQVPGTDYYVLTHSSTDQKIQDLKELLRYLKMPSTLFEITKHRKS